ncbi:MAG: F0F1 ATP synthase subunit delta [Prevotellaceae bacterium]|jgi:F-type H+-transporting ATPase subunit delta|nr:F0F1 ATP synthase subunit delta [Prevotellaceae bacterium]
MNIGVISTRYARALYSLAFDQGKEDVVYKEMNCLLQQFLLFPEFKRYLTSPILKIAKKINLLETAAGGENISLLTKKFIDFVVRRDKQEIIQFMCSAYGEVYRSAKNIVTTRLISATEVDSSFLDKIKDKVEKTYNAHVEMEVKIDKNIIGGFILDVDNNRLDVSILGDLNKMKLVFTE